MNDTEFDEFKRTFAHDLKNPLGAAKGALELIIDGEAISAPEDQARMVQMALRNVTRAIEMVDEMRGSPMSAGRAPGG